MWPGLPASSSPLIALSLAVLNEAYEVLSARKCSPPLAQLLPRLSKASDLLDKAGAALKGLNIRPVITPLLRPLINLACPPVDDEGTEEGQGGGARGALMAPRGSLAQSPDPELNALISEAQAAIYAYVSPTNAGHTAKLIKALQVMAVITFGPHKEYGDMTV